MRFGVLGPITVWSDAGRPVPIPGVKVRAALADLIVHVGEPVTADRLVDDLWGESPDSRNPAGTLSSKVSQLRRALDAPEPGGRALVRSPPPGYELVVDPTTIDAVEFVALVDEAQRDTDPAAVVDLLTRALDLWRGPAYAEFADLEFAQAAVARLDEQRLTAREMLGRARLERGEHAGVADELTELVEAHPWREELRLLHVLALYRSGRQADALQSFEGYRRALAEDLGLDPSAEALALQHAVLVHDPSLAPPGPGPRRPSTNLPAPRAELIGRDDDLAEVVALLGTRRLVTLTGPGGVGKTSLALAAARRAPEFPDGAWLVELARLDRGGAQDSPDALAEAVMDSLAIRQVTEHADTGPVERLTEALRDHRALVVLDNCEQIIDTVARVVDRLLRAAPELTVLATSRERLDVDGEVVRPVPPLSTPEPRDQSDVEAVAQSSAVRLFLDRARAAGADVIVDAWSAPLVGTLCRRLDGMPLALELAATRVPSLGLAEVLARVGDRFRLLGGGRRGGPSRHRTLAAVIDWSWHLLGDDERCVLRRLSAHADGCDLEGAQAVCAGAGIAADAVPDLLGRLVDRSLVVAVHPRAGTRYRLLESVAAYAADRLHEAGEVTQVRRRHLTHHRDLAERAEAHLYGPDQGVWLDRLDTETANMRVALDTAVGEDRAEDALRLVAALGWYWLLRGRLSEARRSLERALAVAGAGPTPARARALAWQAALASVQADASAGERRREALAAVRALDDPVAGARAIWLLGYTALDASDVDEAEALLGEARTICVDHGDRWAEAACLVGLSWVAHGRGDLDGLAATSGRAGELFAAVGDRWGRVVARGWQASLAELTGDLDTAASLIEESRDDAQRLGLWPEVARRLAWSGWIAKQQEDWGRARSLAAQAMRLATEQGSPSTEDFAGMVLGFTARQVGDLDVAEAELGELVRRGEAATGDSVPMYLPTVLAELGFVATQRGDATAALDLDRRALDLALAEDYTRDLVGALEGAAAATGLQGRSDVAARLLGAAARLRDEAGLPPSPAEQRDIDRAAACGAAALGQPEFDRLVADGRLLSPVAARDLVTADAVGSRSAAETRT